MDSILPPEFGKLFNEKPQAGQTILGCRVSRVVSQYITLHYRHLADALIRRDIQSQNRNLGQVRLRKVQFKVRGMTTHSNLDLIAESYETNDCSNNTVLV